MQPGFVISKTVLCLLKPVFALTLDDFHIDRFNFLLYFSRHFRHRLNVKKFLNVFSLSTSPTGFCEDVHVQLSTRTFWKNITWFSCIESSETECNACRVAHKWQFGLHTNVTHAPYVQTYGPGYYSSPASPEWQTSCWRLTVHGLTHTQRYAEVLKRPAEMVPY